MACVSLPPKLSERVVRRVVIVFDDTELIIRINTEFRVERFPRFLYRSRFTEHSPLLSHRFKDYFCTQSVIHTYNTRTASLSALGISFA